jgi:SP family general alpha glucoside:H+ symporter-like MFS transporter
MASSNEKTHLEDRIHQDEFATVKQTNFDQAKRAANEEHQITLRQALRLHFKAVLWSVLLSTCIVMEGYDLVLMSSFFAQPAFSRKYGSYDSKSGTYQVNASWQNGLTNAVSVGTIIGACK